MHEKITYRVEAPHPSRPEISMFMTASRLAAMNFEEQGWTVTPSVLCPSLAELQERVALFGAAVSLQDDEEATRLYLQICNGFKQADAEMVLHRMVSRHRAGRPLVLPEEWAAIEAIALRTASPLRQA